MTILFYFIEWLERTTGCKVLVVHCDGAREFVMGHVAEYLRMKGHSDSGRVPRTHISRWASLSGISGTTADGGAALLADSGLPGHYWGFAYLVNRYVRNRTPSSVLEAGKTPFEEIYKKKPNLSNLRVFGCFCYPAITKEECTKGGPMRCTGIFLGYDKGHVGWYFQCVVSQKVLFSDDIIFDELHPGPFGHS